MPDLIRHPARDVDRAEDSFSALRSFQLADTRCLDPGSGAGMTGEAGFPHRESRQPLAFRYNQIHNHRMKGYVYILASQRNGTLYTGVTSNLPTRLHEHQTDATPGFTSKYGVKTLVWFEEFDLVTDAIAREKAIKNWPRKWKLELIEATKSRLAGHRASSVRPVRASHPATLPSCRT